MINLPSPGEKYDQKNEAAVRRALEQEIQRMNAQLESIRIALQNAVTLPISVRT